MANHFSWFLPFYDANITKAIEKSDIVRYAILHRLGGGCAAWCRCRVWAGSPAAGWESACGAVYVACFMRIGRRKTQHTACSLC